MAKRGPMNEKEKAALAARLQNGRKKGRGKSTKPSRTNAMLMKCYECTVGYVDGKSDCEMPDCPLYSWMPYAKMEPNLDWQTINPKRKSNTPEIDEEEEGDEV